MIYRRFGKSGLQMPVLSMGMMRSMQSWQKLSSDAISSESQQDLESLVHRALELGINHFETARGYGSSEHQLGRILPGLPRDKMIIQTKVGPEDDPAHFTTNVLDSLQNLQLDYIDLLAVHGINDYRSLWQLCRPGGCLAAARRLQNEGRVGWVGFSGHGSTEVILEAVRHQEDGGVDYLNLHWYTIFQQHSPALEEAANRDLGVFIISPSDKGGMLHTPPDILRKISSPLSPMQFNDIFCLSRKNIHTIGLGAARLSDFDEHVKALDYLDDQTTIDTIYQRWQQEMEKATGNKRPDALWSSFPPWERCPGYTNISMILWLDALSRGWDLYEYASVRYKKLGKDMPWISGCNAETVVSHDFSEAAEQAGMTEDELKKRLQDAHKRLS